MTTPSPAHAAHVMPFGAALQQDGGVDFSLWAPGAKSVQLLLLPERGAAPIETEHHTGGWRRVHVADARAGTRYQWLIDGQLAVPDPASRSNPEGPHGPSEVVDARRFTWDAGWVGRPWHEAVFYQLHIGTFTPEGTYAAAEMRLPALAQLGVTAVQLMPLACFPGRFGWGYDGVLPYAPYAGYGTPDALKQFVQAAHRLGLMVFFDVVYNHFGPDGNYLLAYAPQFESKRHVTPWGHGMNFDAEGGGEVREFMIENALYWFDEFRCDGLRLDAVHAMLDDGPLHILDAISQRVRAAFPSRHVHLVLENDINEAARLGAPGEAGRYEGQWNGDFHHCLHVLSTGEHHGYYAEYEHDTMAKLARVLTQGYVYQGAAAGHASGGPRRPADSTLALQQSVNFLQCHDQVGNRGYGERLGQLANADAMRLMSAVLLLTPGVPMLFMGEEFDSQRPFLYFADPDESLREPIRQGRKAEFAHEPHRADTPKRELPDPCSPKSFEESRIETPEQLTGSQREGQAWYAHLIALRRARLTERLPALTTGAHSAERHGDHGLAVRWHFDGGDVLEMRANFGVQPVTMSTRTPLPPVPDQVELLTVGDVKGERYGAWSGRWTWHHARSAS